MATIDEIRTVERLMQTLDENPPLLEALRARVLTRELLELPATYARLAAWVEQIAKRMDQIAEQLAQLTARVGQIEQQLAQLVESVQELRETVSELVERIGRRLQRITDDMAWLKDVAMVAVADRQAMTIAEDLGLEYEKQLTAHEVRDLIRNQDTAGIAPGDLRSFRNADMIIAATDADGQLNYIAVEVSFTADQRDVDRPIRNAGYLTRFTGQPAYAVVASVLTDRRIHDIIESGQIYWHQLYAKSAPQE